MEVIYPVRSSGDVSSSLSGYFDRSSVTQDYQAVRVSRNPTLAFYNISYSISSGWKRKKKILHPLRLEYLTVALEKNGRLAILRRPTYSFSHFLESLYCTYMYIYIIIHVYIVLCSLQMGSIYKKYLKSTLKSARMFEDIWDCKAACSHPVGLHSNVSSTLNLFTSEFL